MLVLSIAAVDYGYSQAEQAPEKAADESPHKTGFVTVNGVRLHYLDWGGTGNVIILLTGLGNDAHVFDGFAPKFTDRFHVIALTRRGFGQSDKPENGYDCATLTEDLHQFLDALKLKRVILIGHSLAGNEMTLFASRWPKRVTKLVYLDAANDQTRTAELWRDCPVIPPFWKRLALEAADDPSAAEIVVKDMPPADEWNVLKAIMKGALLMRPDYTKLRAPALSFYAIPDHCLEVPPNADENTRKEADSWWREKVMPFIRANIEQFRREARRSQIVEMNNAKHYLFLGDTQAEVVRRTKDFLK